MAPLSPTKDWPAQDGCVWVCVWVCNCVCAGYAAQSLLAAIGCVQFVSNVVFAKLVLKEQVRARQRA